MKEIKAILTLGIACITCFVNAGGALSPTSAPAPTMKTLDEVEPRFPIHATNLPFVITLPGSYYLVENIDYSSIGIPAPGAIMINSSDVTLDLMGFSLVGDAGLTASGIPMHGVEVPLLEHNIHIRNGSISGWGGNGVEAWNAENCHINAIRVSGCGIATNITASSGMGITVGANSSVADCLTLANTKTGIFGKENVTLSRCNSSSNTDNGFETESACSLINCTASKNGVSGFKLGQDSRATDCIGTLNTNDGFESFQGSISLVRCTASFNGGNGIAAFYDSQIRNCNVRDNELNGIQVVSNCHVVENRISNHATVNGFYVNGVYGILCGVGSSGGSGNRIERNHLTGNHNGIQPLRDYNVITGNSIIGTTNTVGVGITIAGDRCTIDGNDVREHDIGIQVLPGAIYNMITKNIAVGNGNNFDIDSIPNNRVGEIKSFLGTIDETVSAWANHGN